MASPFGQRQADTAASKRSRFSFRGKRSPPGRVGDLLFRGACMLAANSVIVLAALLTVFLVIQSWPAITALGGSFLTHVGWDPVTDQYGALAFIYGTLATSAIAMVIAVPLSVGTAAFLAEIAPGWLRRSGSFLIELLAAIPSVVYGFWGVFFLAPSVVQKLFNLVGGPNTGGVGILSAGLILSIMIVPYITAISFDVCRAVPRAQREGSLALGATRWQTIRTVVLPYARPGIIGACFLALGRALGETMAVAMLIGNSPKILFSPFATGASIASIIANQLGNTSNELNRSALVELGLVLFLVTVAVNSLARVLIWRTANRGRSPLRRAGVPVPNWTDANGFAGRSRTSSVPRGGRKAVWIDRAMTGVLCACLALTVGPLFPILGYITYRGVRAVNWDFFTHLPIDTPRGLGNALLGSGMLVGLATVFAVPIGILAAIYLAEYRTSRLVGPVRFIGELLGGVPSIIIGIFGYALLVMPFGFSAWAGSFALGVMMIPIVMRASEESLKLVPQTLRNASYALGAANWQTVLRVIVPAALPAIITGVFLAIARIAGETAPLLLTAYNSSFWPTTPSDRTPFLTYYIYTYSVSDDPEEQRLAWAAALVLLTLVMVLNVGIRLLTGKRVVLASRAE
jgi:phosphate transport system permease protein